MGFVVGNYKTMKAAGAIDKGVLVKVSAADTVAAAGLAEQPIGVLEEPALAANDLVAVRLLSSGGTIQARAANAVTVGAAVYGRASGLVDDVSTSSAVLIGIANEAAGATNDLIEVILV